MLVSNPGLLRLWLAIDLIHSSSCTEHPQNDPFTAGPFRFFWLLSLFLGYGRKQNVLNLFYMDSLKVPDYNDRFHDVPDEFELWKIEYSAWNVPRQYIPVQSMI